MQQNFGTKRNHVQIEILSTWQQQLIIVCSSKRRKLALGWIIHSYYNNVYPQPWCNYLLWVIGSHGRCPLIREGKKTTFPTFPRVEFLGKGHHIFLHFLNPKRLLPCGHDQYPNGIITHMFISIFFGFKTRVKYKESWERRVLLDQCRMYALWLQILKFT